MQEPSLTPAFKAKVCRIVEMRCHLHQKRQAPLGRLALSRRREDLLRAFATLKAGGYRLKAPENFSAKHVDHLVQTWTVEGKSAATLHTYLSHLRAFAEAIDKPGLVKPLSAYLEDPEFGRRETIATANPAWVANGVDPETVFAEIAAIDPRAAMVLELQRHFGLRIQEAICLRPWRDREANTLTVWDGTKGGRQRQIPIETLAQEDVMRRCRELCGGPRKWLIPVEDRVKARQWVDYRIRILGGVSKEGRGVTSHGLRAQYAQEQYFKLTGWHAPIDGGRPEDVTDIERHNKACYAVALLMGRSRIDVSRQYLGSFGHALRGAD